MYGVDVARDTGTWHYGLVARWWAEFNVAGTEEIAAYADAIRTYGEPALDLGCGTGRLLVPLLASGLDVDGVDISADMVQLADAALRRRGLTTRLAAQPTHELKLDRTYRTIFMCGVFGIGGRRDHDRETLRRVFQHLDPGGTLLIDHELPYQGQDERSWAIWLAGHREGIPGAWPEAGDRRRAADGDEIELLGRQTEFDPLAQTLAYEMRARLWRDGVVVDEEAYGLRENLYFAQEIRLLLEEAGYNRISMQAGMTDLTSGAAPIQDPAGGRRTQRPATADDGKVLFVAHRPSDQGSHPRTSGLFHDQ